MILDDFKLDGKVAIVTGCNTGLGQGMALALAEAGADIFGVYNSGTGDTPELVEKLGRKFVGYQANLCDTSVVQGIVDAALKAYGHIDILVNNAGTIRREDSVNFSEKDWDDVINVNLKSLFFFF